jgi:hypothetical protein
MQRYHVFWGGIVEAPEPFVEEAYMWMLGEADADQSREKSGVRPGEEDIRVQARNAGLQMPDDRD